MRARVGGMLLVVLGIALALLGISGLVRGTALSEFADTAARHFSATGFDGQTWRAHWTFWNAGVGCAGVAFVVAGAALALRRRWGLLVMAGVLFLIAVTPLVLQMLGVALFPSERPRVGDTVILLSFAAIVAASYFRRPGTDA